MLSNGQGDGLEPEILALSSMELPNLRSNTFCIHCSDTQALCSPILPMSNLSQRQQDGFRSLKYSVEEWSKMFLGVLDSQATSPSLLDSTGKDATLETRTGPSTVEELQIDNTKSPN